MTYLRRKSENPDLLFHFPHSCGRVVARARIACRNLMLTIGGGEGAVFVWEELRRNNEGAIRTDSDMEAIREQRQRSRRVAWWWRRRWRRPKKNAVPRRTLEAPSGSIRIDEPETIGDGTPRPGLASHVRRSDSRRAVASGFSPPLLVRFGAYPHDPKLHTCCRRRESAFSDRPSDRFPGFTVKPLHRSKVPEAQRACSLNTCALCVLLLGFDRTSMTLKQALDIF